MAFGGESAESYYDEGLTASMKGDLPRAIAHFEKALQIDRSYFAAYHQLAKCYMRQGDPARAARLLRQVAAVKPAQLPVRVDLGFALLDMGQLEEAEHTFREVLERKPDTARAALGLAQCAFRRGEWEAASEAARRSIALGGASFAALFLLGRACKLQDLTDESLEALYRASELMDKFIESNPEQPEGHYLRGEVHFLQEQYAKALEDFMAAGAQSEPGRRYLAYGEEFTQLDILARCGLCQHRLGQIRAAIKTGENLLKLAPEHKTGRFLAGLPPPEQAG